MSPPFGRSGKVPDYYALLGVSPNASKLEISKAYKRESLLHHPDRNDQSPESTYRFQLIADAYQTLRDPSLRREYDAACRTRGTTRFFEAGNNESNEKSSQDYYSGGGKSGFADTASRMFQDFWKQYTESGGGKTDAQGQFFSMFQDYLKSRMGSEQNTANPGQSGAKTQYPDPPDGPNTGSAFDMRGALTGGLWSTVCMAGLAVVGFALADSKGAVAGAVAGKLIGGMRDRTGRSALDSWKSLPANDRQSIVGDLARWFFAQAINK